MENLYNYVIHFNHYKELWYAIPREKYQEYWNDHKADGILCAKDINVLVDVIMKGKKFIKSIK